MYENIRTHIPEKYCPIKCTVFGRSSRNILERVFYRPFFNDIKLSVSSHYKSFLQF